MTDPMHQLLGKMQALMGKHRDAPVMLETEPAPATDEAPRATPFPVLTDIVRRAETLADVSPVAPQPEPDFTLETAPPVEVTDSTPEAFTSNEQTEAFAAVDAMPVLTDIVWHGEVLAEASPNALQPAPGFTAEIVPPVEVTDSIPEAFTRTEQTGSFATVNVTPILADIVWQGEVLADAPPVAPQPAPDFTMEIAPPVEVTDNIPEAFTSPEQAEPVAATLAMPVATDIEWHGEVLEVSPNASQPAAPDTTAEIAHLAATADSIPQAFTTPEQAELLANSVATHVLGMIDGHLMYQVNTVMAQRLRRVVDDTLSTLLTQLALDIESIVREAVAEELARHGIRPADTPENPSNPV